LIPAGPKWPHSKIQHFARHLAERKLITGDGFFVKVGRVVVVGIHVGPVIDQQVDRVQLAPLELRIGVEAPRSVGVGSEAEFDSVNQFRPLVQHLDGRPFTGVVVPQIRPIIVSVSLEPERKKSCGTMADDHLSHRAENYCGNCSRTLERKDIFHLLEFR